MKTFATGSGHQSGLRRSGAARSLHFLRPVCMQLPYIRRAKDAGGCRMNKAVLTLQLPRLCLYQLRHGGASEDILSGNRPLAQARVRGRWLERERRVDDGADALVRLFTACGVIGTSSCHSSLSGLARTARACRR